MSTKLTEPRISTLLETLNALICEDDMLTREQRENMIRTVATLGGLAERVRQATAAKESSKPSKAEKKPREPDAVFPRSGKPWSDDDLSMINSIIDDLPDDQIDHHILWLSTHLARTPYAIALKIVGKGRSNEEWAKSWKEAAKDIRAKQQTESITSPVVMP